MGNFSNGPDGPDRALREAWDRGYRAARIEQGVPLLDRDLNLLGGLPLAALQHLASEYLGDGASSHEAFRIDASGGLENDFRIQPGSFLLDGRMVTNSAALRYGEQADVPPLTTPSSDRRDLVYLDVFEQEVDHTTDPALGNPTDVGMATSTRIRTAWRVRVREGWDGAAVAAAPGHHHAPLSVLVRPAGQARISDPVGRNNIEQRLRHPWRQAFSISDVPFLSMTPTTTAPPVVVPLPHPVRCLLMLGGIQIGSPAAGVPAIYASVLGLVIRDDWGYWNQLGIETIAMGSDFRSSHGVYDRWFASLRSPAHGLATISIREWDDDNDITLELVGNTLRAPASVSGLTIIGIP